MTSFLIDRNSPIRSVGDTSSSSGLHHRSRHSTESENGSPLHHPNPRQHDIKDDKNAKEDQSPKDEKSKNIKGGPSMFSYFKSEVTRSYKLEEDASEFVQRRDRIYVSVNTPKNLEKFCAFGLLQCLDSFLYIMTFLPLRIVVALMNVLAYPFSVIFFKKKAILNAAQICDLLKGVILIVSCFITSYIDTSMVYHMVRTQSTIKFYVIYNMLDVMDKLISGFGQDVLDSLYWTAVEPRGRKREHFGTIFHLILSITYVVIHTTLILIQAITLNVAFNSHNKSLLTIMLSNNFVEIKANLFKRLDKNTLCQITYVDVKERFHYFILLLFILIHNLLEKNWLRDQASIYFVDALIVLGVEVVVDWIKHSFITKINEFSASYYGDFAIGLAQDIASSQKKHALTDFSDQVCRRMGFTPIPLTCLLYMVCRKSFEITGLLSWFIVFMLFLCLFTTKVLNSIILLGWAQYLITEGDKNAKSTVIVGNSQVIPKKDDNKSEKKKVKTESISHCPDMTSNLTHSMLSSHTPDIHTDSKPYSQASPAPISSLPLQNEGFPMSTNFESEFITKSKSEVSGDRFVEHNLQFQSSLITAPDPLHQNKTDGMSCEKDSFKVEMISKETEDKEIYDNNESMQDCSDDLYNIQLQDISDSSCPITQEKEMLQSSISFEVSPEVLETEATSSSPSLEDSMEPFMLKLASCSPPHYKGEKTKKCSSENQVIPSPSHSVLFVDVTAEVNDQKQDEAVSDILSSSDTHTKRNAEDISPPELTEL